MFDERSVDEIKNGYYYDREGHGWRCLYCGAAFDCDEVFHAGGRLLNARAAAAAHVAQAHGSSFEQLIDLDKKLTGLSPAQKDIMRRFYDGQDDRQIARAAGLSPSTVRYQRFSLREKARRAKIFLALADLMEKRAQKADIQPVPQGATMIDERFIATRDERERAIKACFTSIDPPVLALFPPREKRKIIVLGILTGLFEKGLRYSEAEVNNALRPVYHDFATIRRYMIEYGFMRRTADGREYWLNTADTPQERDQL